MDTNTHAMWPLLLQKAWAKLERNYNAVQYGTPYSALHALTGAPTVYVDASVLGGSTELEVYTQLKSNALDNYFPLIACTTSTSGAAYGLKAGYCYTFIDIFTITIDSTAYYIALYRDPSGQRTYNGLHKDMMNPDNLATR